jgi:MFS family permease
VLVGPHGAFVADSISFMASALILAQLPDMPVRTAARIGSTGLARGFNAGLHYIATRRALLTAVLGMAAALFLIFLFDSLGALALRAIGLGESWLGLAVGGVGLGTAVGAVVIGQWGGRVHPFGIMGAGQVLTGMLVAGLGVIVSLGINATNPAWLIGWLLMGLVAAAMLVPYGFILQSQTPPEIMGRVAAAASVVQTLCQLVAPPLGAVIAEVYGIGVVFTAAGSGLAVVGLAVLLARPALAASPETVGA